MKHAVLPVLALIAASAAWAQDEHIARVFGAINVAPGQHAGDVSTVNGSVNIGEDAAVGHASAVNGAIHLHKGASATSVSSVNGAIHLGEGGHVTGQVRTVNGSMHIEPGAEITGDLANVNGSIQLKAAHVGGGIDTVNGDIDIGPDARVDGDVVVEQVHSWWDSDRHVPRIIIRPGSVVKGTLRFKREVRLYVSDRARIGPVEGATIEHFSGEQPQP
jgi:cytoskeletal protein CcmA (bactofilin family)